MTQIWVSRRCVLPDACRQNSRVLVPEAAMNKERSAPSGGKLDRERLASGDGAGSNEIPRDASREGSGPIVAS